MKKEQGICISFGPTFGFLGVGVYTNGCYEDRVYVHYKQIQRDGLRDKGFRELKPMDLVEFEYGTGYFCEGTQAVNVKVISFAKSEDKE